MTTQSSAINLTGAISLDIEKNTPKGDISLTPEQSKLFDKIYETFDRNNQKISSTSIKHSEILNLFNINEQQIYNKITNEDGSFKDANLFQEIKTYDAVYTPEFRKIVIVRALKSVVKIRLWIKAVLDLLSVLFEHKLRTVEAQTSK